MKKSFLIGCSLILPFLVVGVRAQDLEVNGGQQQAAPAAKAGQKGKGKTTGKPSKSAPSAANNGFGFGISIDAARQARAAESALKHGNPTAAANYAQRAIQAAPQNSNLWLLLGYTSRLAGKMDQSVQAYNHVLQLDPKSLDAKSGLAQTYMRAGRNDEAKRLLSQVLAVDPQRQNDLLVAGELYLRTGDPQGGINYLQRADNVKPSAHAELLMAPGESGQSASIAAFEV